MKDHHDEDKNGIKDERRRGKAVETYCMSKYINM